MTPAQTLRLIAALRAAYPSMTLSDETIAVYTHDLLDLDYEPTMQAVEQIRKTSTWFPSIAEIRKETVTVVLGLPQPVEAFAGGDFGSRANALVLSARRLVGDSWHWRTAQETDLRRQFYEAWSVVTERAFAESNRSEEGDELAELMPAMQAGIGSWGAMS